MKEVTKGRGLLAENEQTTEQLKTSELEIARLKGEMEAIKTTEERKKMEERMKQMEEDRRKLEEGVVLEQRLMEMINVSNTATELCADLGVVPNVTVEATMITTPTESGKRVDVAALIGVKGREEKYLCTLPKINELVSYLQQARLQREEVRGGPAHGCVQADDGRRRTRRWTRWPWTCRSSRLAWPSSPCATCCTCATTASRTTTLPAAVR
jgi:hypothetical protein